MIDLSMHRAVSRLTYWRSPKTPTRWYTSFGASHVLNATEIPFHSDAYTVVLIRKLKSSYRIVIEGPYCARNPSEVLQTSLLSSVDATAGNLSYPDSPRSIKASAAGYKRQGHRIRLTRADVYIHCRNWIGFYLWKKYLKRCYSKPK